MSDPLNRPPQAMQMPDRDQSEDARVFITFTPGQQYKVKRSTGEIESGWTLVALQDGLAVLQKISPHAKIGDKTPEKKVRVSDLQNWQG